MKNNKHWCVILLLMFFSSCLTTGEKNVNVDRSVSNVLDEVIINISEVIIKKLPQNSTVALFNNSNEQTELTSFAIEELSSILVNKGGLIIVEREKFKSIESEHKWQMETGYVSDDQITSITEKFGAQYVVSCYISGDGALQRLRIKAWDVRTGQTMASGTYPTNDFGVALVNVKGNEGQTIRKNGITIDYAVESRTNNKFSIVCSIYIDGTQFYSLVNLIHEKYINNGSVGYFDRWLILHSNGRVEETLADYISDVDDGIESFVNKVTTLLKEEGGAERRSIDIISGDLMKTVLDSLKN